MDKLIDYVYIVPICILYNSLFYQLTNVMHKNVPFVEKRDNAIVILIFGALIGIFLSGEIEKKYEPIGKGIKYGGYMLLISTFINFWQYMSEELKLLGTGLCFGGIIYYYNKQISDDNKQISDDN